MKYLRGIFLAMVGVCEAVACFRFGKIAVELINDLFDKWEDEKKGTD